MTNICSSHGTLGITKTGIVVTVSDISATKEISKILRFDIAEYKKFYSVEELPPAIDILDIGYWSQNPKRTGFEDALLYEAPAADWREEVAAMRFISEIEIRLKKAGIQVITTNTDPI